jgi:hypothetical protein
LELANIADAEFFSSTSFAAMKKDPEMQREALEPLLAYVRQAKNTEDFPADQMRQWFDRSRDESVSEELAPMERAEPLYNLAVNVAQTFWFYLDEIVWDFADANGTAHLLKANGRVDVKFFDPFRDYFEPAIRGIEIERIRRCLKCKKIFFALRYKPGSKYDSKACSPRCTQALRVSEWRKNEEERVNQARILLMEGKDLKTIAKVLQVSDKKARAYAAAAKKRTQEESV